MKVLSWMNTVSEKGSKFGLFGGVCPKNCAVL
jgi:hypothetical protein